MKLNPIVTRLAMIAIVALFVTACGRSRPQADTPTATPTPTIFSSETGGFLLTVPAGWTATEATDVAFGDHTILGQVDLAPESPAGQTERPGLIYYADARELSPEQAVMTLCHQGCPSLPAMSEITLSGCAAWTTIVEATPWTFVDNGDVLVFFNMPHAEDAGASIADPLAFTANSMYFTPIIDGKRRAHEAADALRESLVLQLGADVQIAGIDAITWPDACLGAPLTDELCAEAATPGYRIELATPAGVYAYHLEPISTQIRLAEAPEPQTGNPVIVWSSTSQPCMTALIGVDGLGFGACGGVLMPGELADDDRRAEVASFAATYAGFEAQTPAGDLSFFGDGTRIATPTEARMIAEWARQTAAAAFNGDDAHEPVMNWTRKGGILNACDALEIDSDGRVQATSCRDGKAQAVGQRMLMLEEAVQFYTWVDLLREIKHSHEDAATSDGLAVTLSFAGAGLQDGASTDSQAMLIFTAAIFDEMAAAAELKHSALEWVTGCPDAMAGTLTLANEVDGYCLLYPEAYDLFQPTPNQVAIAVDSMLNFNAPSIIVTTAPADGRTLDEAAVEETEGPAAAAPSFPVMLTHDDRVYSLQFYPADSSADDGPDIDQLYEVVTESFMFLP